MVESLPEIITVAIAMVAFLAEALHLRRLNRVRHLAFGPRAKPAFWTRTVPFLRVAGISAACWGLLSLLFVVEAQVHNKDEVDEKDMKHLILIVDVSPSMNLKDAGPEGDRTRRQRASDVLESLFNRIPMRQFKVTVIATYSDAKLLLQDSRDHEVVRHIVEKMPLWHAFKSGKTKLLSGIQLAAKTAKPWNPGSTYVVMLTDGDTVPTTGMPKMPVSVADTLIIGVGNSNSGTFIDDHVSRQDVATLRQVANRLRGDYHDGNKKHITSQVIEKFANLQSKSDERNWNRREWALLAIAVGSMVLSVLPILLHYFGTQFHGGTPVRQER